MLPISVVIDHSQGPLNWSDMESSMFMYAAINNSVESLEYLEHLGCPYENLMASILEMQIAYESQKYIDGMYVPVFLGVPGIAINRMKYEVLDFAYSRCRSRAPDKNAFDMNIAELIIKTKCTHVMRWQYISKLPFHPNSVELLVQHTNIDLIKYMMRLGITMSKDSIMDSARKHDKIGILRWAKSLI